MYVPRFNAMDEEDEIRGLVTSVGSAELVSVGADGFPVATLLPVMWHAPRLIFHMARANPQWLTIEADSPGLAIVTGPQGYVSPSWYASKAEHGRVVPTWNYSAVHFTGRLRVHHDPSWLLDAVTLLTEVHEKDRKGPWSVGDAPQRYVEKQLRAIVGIEMSIEKVEGKAKLSQNRSDADRAGVVAGLRRDGGPRERELSDSMSDSMDGSAARRSLH
jgi:transcriptional regulator